MCTLQKRSERNRMPLLQRGECNAHCYSLNPGARGKHLVMQILWVTDWQLVIRVCFIYLGDEFFFLFLVKLNKMSAPGESKFFSFSFWFESGDMRKWDESKISFCYPKGLRASTQTYHERGGVTYCVYSVCRWLS